MKIVVLSSHTPSLFWFRMDMMQSFIKEGCEVIAIGNESEEEWKSKFQEKNIKYTQAFVSRNGTNPIGDLKTFFSLHKILKQEKPDKIFSYQAKSVIYGSLAAYFLSIKEIYSLIAGIGSVFMDESFKGKIIKNILKLEYKLALGRCSKVFFQNKDDVELFTKERMVKADKVVMINGSGVNLELFPKTPLPKNFSFLCVGRLIRDKGIWEYLQAARIVKKEFPQVQFSLVGPFDTNPSAIKQEELAPFIEEGTIDYFGEQTNVYPFLKNCSVFVLPSYREGTPKSVLEAMAVGRAIITTDAPGCRETVVDGENGFLVEVANSDDLAQKMILMLNSPKMLDNMAERSRKIAEEKFDVKKVNLTINKAMKIVVNMEEKENVTI